MSCVIPTIHPCTYIQYNTVWTEPNHAIAGGLGGEKRAVLVSKTYSSIIHHTLKISSAGTMTRLQTISEVCSRVLSFDEFKGRS